MQNQIKLVQVPVIQHKLVEVGKNVSLRIEELNLSKLVATEDTIKSLKDLRAELNKEFTEFETQRKTLKEAVTNPYMEFENVYKTEITEKYKGAVDILKNKIGEFEDNVKAEKRDNIQSYFTELCLDADIDFVKFSDTNIEVNLSTSEKKYKETCLEFVTRITDDVKLIEGIEYPAETMAEYKKTLNASKAITTIRERKEAERIEKERIKTIETTRRLSLLRNLSMVYRDMTKSYNWVQDDSVYMVLSEIEDLPKEDFTKRFVEIETVIKEYEAAKKTQETPKEEVSAPIAPPLKAPPLKAPVQEVVKEQQEPVKVIRAEFRCFGTMVQLRALGQYMKDNNIKYENI